jgi:hypothetical protein
MLARAVADGRITLDAGDGFRVEPPKADGWALKRNHNLICRPRVCPTSAFAAR